MNNIAKKSPENFFSSKFMYQECLNSDAILDETDTFEEYPIIYRLRQIEMWRITLPAMEILPMWINCAVFLLNNYSLINKSKAGVNFLCLTFTDFCEEHPPIPKIFTSSKIKKDELILKLNASSNSSEINIIKNGFAAINLSKNFNFYESRFFDEASNSEIIRVYCVSE